MLQRRISTPVQIGNLFLGGNHPVVIQSMTDTDTADADITFEQIKELADAGSEMVRVTVMDADGAKAIPLIKERMTKEGYDIPLIGDFHFVGHRLLSEHPECAEALDKYRINPGNVGEGDHHDENFSQILKIALKYDKPVRIGVNAGSLDEELFTSMTDENAQQKNPKSDKEILRHALIASALISEQFALNLGVSKNKIILSLKVSDVQDVVWCYEQLAQKTSAPLHLGLTEAGMGDKGIVASSAALAILLQQGIGDTIRVSLTPEPNVSRAREVEICKVLLQTMGVRSFQPLVTSCPGCGRTNSDFFRTLAAGINADIQKNIQNWKARYPGVENLTIAVMGCVVNGPGESRHVDIGISLPGKMEDPQAPVYIDGKKHSVLKGDNIAQQFLNVLHEYVRRRFGTKER